MKKDLRQEERGASLGRHQSQCSVCSHPQRQEIEEAWLNWGNTTLLADHYKVSRDAIYRHMKALGLFSERQKRVKFAYEKIIERLDMVSVSGSTVLAALKAYISLCEREEAKQASALAPQEVSRPMSDQEPDVLEEDGSFPEEATANSLGDETGAAAEDNQQVEQGAIPVPSQEVQNLESTANNTLQ
jgi:hypothetical protein